MMAMTPHDCKQLDELELAFMEAVEPHQSKTTTGKGKAAMVAHQPRRSKLGSWWSNMKERMVSSVVCCAPPSALMDEQEFEQLLSMVEGPVVIRPGMDALSRKKSALVAAISTTTEPISPTGSTTTDDSDESDIDGDGEAHTEVIDLTNDQEVTGVSDEPTVTEESAITVWNDTVAFAVHTPDMYAHFEQVHVALTDMFVQHKAEVALREARSADIIQCLWRKASSMSTKLLEDSQSVTNDMATTATNQNAGQTRRRRTRSRKHNGRKKPRVSPKSASPTWTIATASRQNPPLAKKRSRSVVEPMVAHDVERDSHILFGDEEIDDDDEIVMATLTAEKNLRVSSLRDLHNTFVSLADVVPMASMSVTCFPETMDAKEHEAVGIIQRAFRARRARKELELRRSVRQYEADKQSVMPTIRSKMALLRRRLDDMRQRSSSMESETASVDDDDDFDWL